MLIEKILLIALLFPSLYGCTLEPNFNQASVIKKTYYSNGKLKEELTYKCGKLNGASRLFRESGELWVEGNYINGKKEGEQNTYEDGSLIKKSEYKNGKPESIIYYLSSNTPRIRVEYKKGCIFEGESLHMFNHERWENLYK